MTFTNSKDSHEHSLRTLNALYEYDDFMASIQTVLDLGCGTGEDLEWWATRTTRDESATPLNIHCTGVDLSDKFALTKRYNNVFYQQKDFESEIATPKKSLYDVLWCHDAFQYCINPIATLSKWWHIASENAMLIIIIPQTSSIQHKRIVFDLPSGCYYHYTMVNLMQMLAVSGWDCREGFFFQQPQDPWIHAVAYKSSIKPMDPKITNWYMLSDLNLLPESADRSIQAHGYLRQQDLVVPWLDKSFLHMGQY